MRGRKPTPPYLKLLRGNPGKRAMKAGMAVERAVEIPAPLDFLSEYAADEWRRLAPEMTRLGCLSRLDWACFGAYCDSYATWRTAVESLNRMAEVDPKRHGLLVKGADGNAVQNPLVRIERQAAENMVRIASEFGMTPAARSRINGGEAMMPRPPSKFGDLLAGPARDDPDWLGDMTIAAPVCTALPVIARTDLMVGEVVTCDNGTWTGADVVYSWQWRSAGFPIFLENDVDYVLSINDTGEMVDCVVYAWNQGGLAFVYAAPVGPIDARAKAVAP